MEILLKIIFAVLFISVAAIIGVAMILISLMIEIKLIANRNRKLKEELTKEEIKLLELTRSLSKFNEKVASHIEVLVEKHKGLIEEKCRCTDGHNYNP